MIRTARSGRGKTLYWARGASSKQRKIRDVDPGPVEEIGQSVVQKLGLYWPDEALVS